MVVLAALAIRTNADDPVSALDVTDHPEPSPLDGWVRVAVKAAALNHHDVWTLRGVGVAEDRLPIVLGCDAAGVDEDGNEVVVHAVIGDPSYGDETLDPKRSLLSEVYDGTLAEQVAVPAGNLVPKPASLSFEEAACLPTAWLTAYRMLFAKSGLRPGDRVLIQGAGGGVATAAIALARAAGFVVWATSRSEDKRRRAVELGAHDAFETGARLPARVDAVIDSIGAATYAHSLKSLRPGGVLVSCGATSGYDPPADLRQIYFLQRSVVGSTMGSRRELAELVSMLDATGVRPVIDSVVPLAEVGTGLRRMVAGELVGKVVVTP